VISFYNYRSLGLTSQISRLHRMHEMLTIVIGSASVCLSCGFAVHMWLNGPSCSLVRQLLRTQRTHTRVPSLDFPHSFDAVFTKLHRVSKNQTSAIFWHNLAKTSRLRLLWQLRRWFLTSTKLLRRN